MPVVINEVVIRTEVQPNAGGAPVQVDDQQEKMMEDLLKKTVEKVLEIIEENKHR